MMKYRISIIIPVFNIEDYIKEALESIVRQTIGFEHLEVIMVDDCSTDESGEIIDEYASKYDNFTAIHLPENSRYAGKPRNIGMEIATGEYLMFLDPDDYYTDNACELLYKKIKNGNEDIVFGKFNILLENGNMINASSWYPVYSKVPSEIKNIKINNKELLYRSPPSVMTKIFKRDFIEKNNICFSEGIPGEDLVFAAHCFLKTDKITYIDENILIIRKRETKNKSVTFIINDKYINGSIQAFADINQICEENDKEVEFPLIMENRFPFWFDQFVLSNLTISEKKNSLELIRPLLEKYHDSGFTLPDKFMPILENIINKKFDDAILLFDQLNNLKKSKEKNVNEILNDEGYIISIIITTQNSQKTVPPAVSSALNYIYKDKIEIIVIDNCSDSDKATHFEHITNEYNNLKLIKLEDTNIPKARNIGIKESNGKYITFLDNNDEIHVYNLLKMVNYANMYDIDCIKGYIQIIENNKIKDYNKLECSNRNQLNIIKNIISGIDTGLNIVIKRDFIIENNIIFNEDFKFGGETLFYADLLTYNPKIDYYNSFIKYHHNDDIKNTNSIRKYQDQKLENDINICKITEKKFKKIGISYYELNLHNIVKNIINSIIHSNDNISNDAFDLLSTFINENSEYLTNLVLNKRYESIYNSIIKNDYKQFLETSKKRLLVAGHDLKFIEPALNHLNDDYNIKIDKWEGENSHNEQESKKLLNWADYIFCEWLLGNAVWYSQRKMDHQKLIIRAHKFELSRNFGKQVDFGNVNNVIAITYYFLELFSNVFKIPREKMIMLSNYVETDIYTGVKTDDFKYNLAIVGYVPRWKGLLRGLKILKMLKETDEKFKLYLIGKHYSEVNWIWNNSKERSYFQECENFIKENDLEDSVIIKGWTERSKMFNNIGYVLSVSDIEGSHQSPAEGLVDSSLALLLNWEGVEYVYPNEIIFDDITGIKDMILATYNDNDKYYTLLNKMRDYAITEFNIEKFIEKFKLVSEKID